MFSCLYITEKVGIIQARSENYSMDQMKRHQKIETKPFSQYWMVHSIQNHYDIEGRALPMIDVYPL